MDTVAKGDNFEDLVFKKVQELLKNHQLGLSPSQAKIFKKKGYLSKNRNSDIIVDIAIEVWPPNANNYSLLWVCECKNYSGLVPVNDVEEFKAKLDQIAGKNVKGVIASRNALQRGALDYARSNGIGVVRILPDDQVDWIHYRVIPRQRNKSIAYTDKEITKKEIADALINQNHRGDIKEIAYARGAICGFYATDGAYLFGNWASFLSHSLKI